MSPCRKCHKHTMLTVDEIIAQQKVFTPEQRSLAYMPEPPKERFAADCRPGGNCGLDFSNDSLHARWLRARFRLHQEQKAIAARAKELQEDEGWSPQEARILAQSEVA